MMTWLTAGAVIAVLGMMALVFVTILVYAVTRRKSDKRRDHPD
jgi:hypothetical protein